MKMKIIIPLILFFGITSFAFGQERTVSGKLSTADGNPLPGATILEKGTTNGTISDFNGKYSLKVSSSDAVLQFKFIGYVTKEVAIGNQSEINTTMEQTAQSLKTVIVSGLGIKKDKDQSGSASGSIGGSDVIQSGESGIIQGMTAKTSGLLINRTSGDPGAGAYIQIRGQNTITGNTQPLIVIDGQPIINSSRSTGANGAFDPADQNNDLTGGVIQQSRLNDINPNDIESIEVLKGAAAAALWGTRAANGVIVVTTKSGASNVKSDKPFNVSVRSALSVDQINIEHPKQTAYGQGSGGRYSPTSAFNWGDKIADRPGGDDFVIDGPGKYFSAGGSDLYGGYFEAEDGTKYYAIPSAGSAVYDANGNAYPNMTGAGSDTLHGGKRSTDVANDPNRDQVFRNGLAYDNSISLSNANEAGSFFLSIADYNQTGIFNGNSDYRRSSVRINVKRNISEKFSGRINSTYSRVASNRVQSGSNLNGLYLGYLRTPADFDNSDYKGSYNSYNGIDHTPSFNAHRGYRRYLGNSAPTYNNPGWTIFEQINTTNVDRFLVNPELVYNINNSLSLTYNSGIDYSSDKRITYFPYRSGGSEASGRLNDEELNESEFTQNLYLRGSRYLNENISASAILGFQLNDRSFRTVGGTSAGFIVTDNPPLNFNNTTAANNSAFNYIEKRRTAASYLVLNFDMFNQLFLEFTGRGENSSTFPSSSIFYPSASAAWQFTQLDQFKNNNVLSFGKLRASYGTVGIEPRPYITSTDYVSAGSASGWGPFLDAAQYGGSIFESVIQGNPDIQPERKTEVEIGADLRFLDDRFSLSATYYTNTTEGAIFQVDVPASTGFSSKWDNAATISNTGVEIDLNANVLKVGDFRWDALLIYSRNRNLVENLSGVTSVLLNGFTGTSSRAVEGQPLGVLWGGKWDRDANGELILDANGFPTQALEEGILGDPNPDWRGSFGSTFSFKGLSLNVLFETAQGMDMWGGTKGVMTYFGTHESTANEVTASSDLTTYSGAVIPSGTAFRGAVENFGGGDVALDQSWYTSMGGGFGPVAEQFIYDASWTRLRELTLGYTLNSKSFREKTKLNSINFGITGRNLFVWMKTAPEDGGFEGNDPEMNLTGVSNGRGLDYFSNPGTKSWLFSITINY